MDKNPAQLTVMTMNLRFGLAEDGENGWAHRKSLVKKILRTYPVDFLGLQEVNHFQTIFLKSILPDHQFVGWHNKSVDSWQNNLLFFHQSWQCLKHSHYFLSHTPQKTSIMEGAEWPRQCVIGWFKRGKQELLIANTHFDFNSRIQMESAGLVVDFLSEFPEGLPAIITGDFNCNPDSLAFGVFKNNGFKEVFGYDTVTTFHEFEGKSTGSHLDWILYRDALSPVSRQVIKDSFSNRFPSDHYPVQARFEWKSIKR